MALKECVSTVDERGRELLEHGTALFPAVCYHDNLEVMKVPWHWHEEIETTIVEGGDIVLSVGGETCRVRPGDGFFINTGVLHGMWPAAAGSCRLRAVLYHPRLVGGGIDSIFYQGYLQPLLSDPCRPYVLLHQSVPWEREALEAIQRAWEACAEEPPGYEFQVRAALSREVFLLCAHCPAERRTPPERTLRAGERIKAMLQHIEEHYGEELTTARIARSAAVSESECLRCFRAMLGTTPIQYVKQLRIQKAAELLLSTGRRVADIAAQCGFQDASYFTRTFREHRGCSPAEYRRNRGLATPETSPHPLPPDQHH